MTPCRQRSAREVDLARGGPEQRRAQRRSRSTLPVQRKSSTLSAQSNSVNSVEYRGTLSTLSATDVNSVNSVSQSNSVNSVNSVSSVGQLCQTLSTLSVRALSTLSTLSAQRSTLSYRGNSASTEEDSVATYLNLPNVSNALICHLIYIDVEL